MLCLHPGKFGAEQENLRRIIHPHEQDHKRSGGAIGGAGGNASSSLTFDDTVHAIKASTFTGTATMFPAGIAHLPASRPY